jgi:hypothetical protein
MPTNNTHRRQPPKYRYAARIPANWEALPHLDVKLTAALLCCSQAKIYKLRAEGRLTMAYLASNRVGVPTADVRRLLAETRPWTPGRKHVAPVAALAERRKAARRQRDAIELPLEGRD